MIRHLRRQRGLHLSLIHISNFDPIGEYPGDMWQYARSKVIAETIAGKLGIGTKSITDAEAPQYLGFLAGFAGLDNPTSNDKTRSLLGWEPTSPGWVEDVQTGHYFS